MNIYDRPPATAPSASRVMFPQTAEAAKMMTLFLAMKPCIEKCMISRFGTVEEMAMHYPILHEECTSIILKNMQSDPTCTPGMCSSAVHSYVMHQNLYCNALWRVVSALFEYTSMELEAAITVRKQAEASQSSAHISPHNAWAWWGGGRADDKMHPHEFIQQTHATVHESQQRLEQLEDKIDKILSALQPRGRFDPSGMLRRTSSGQF